MRENSQLLTYRLRLRDVRIGFSSESELEAFFSNNVESRTTLFGLVFMANSFSDDTGKSLVRNAPVTYKIRLRAEGYVATYLSSGASSARSSQSGWNTGAMYLSEPRPGPRGDAFGGQIPGAQYPRESFSLTTFSYSSIRHFVC